MLLRPLLIATAAVVAASLGVVASGEDPPETVEVVLKQGTVEGVRDSIGESRFFYSFRGIPYAAPPVGDLRFEDPAPVSEWTGVRKGKEPSPCPQFDMMGFATNDFKAVGDEDCLYLHVYTPEPSSGNNLPVMVFIHGGGFFMGTADMVGGTPKPLLKKDIVLVSIQYRIGTLGFMSTGDSVLPGNLGLKDQSFALKWVQENIGKFGGDPSRVTIFGESAGAGSSHFHTVTPYSKGLFHRAILMSGTTLNPWSVRDDHRERALRIARSFNCPGADDSQADSKQLLQCFKQRSMEELTLGAVMDTVDKLPLYMVPRVDGDYVPLHPGQILREGRHNKVDLMSGVCQNENGNVVLDLLKNDTLRTEMLEDFDRLWPIKATMHNEDNSPYLVRRGLYHYMGALEVTQDNAEGLDKYLSDSFMNVGHDEATILHARDAAFGKRTYRYEVQHRAQISFIDFIGYSYAPANKWVVHGDDLPYLFEGVFGIHFSRADDLYLREVMVDLWTNFARTGNPTPDLKLGFKWEPMTSEHDLRYLALIPAPLMRDDNRSKNREFWRNMPMKVNKALFPERFVCTEDIC